LFTDDYLQPRQHGVRRTRGRFRKRHATRGGSCRQRPGRAVGRIPHSEKLRAL